MTQHHGATAAEWAHWSLLLGLTADLLPTVADPAARISPLSTLKAVGKVPSRYNIRREVVGIPAWTAIHATEVQIELWSKERNYGICLQARHVVAIDVDVDATARVAQIRSRIVQLLGVSPPARARPGKPRVVLAVACDAGVAHREVRIAGGGVVELLGEGQQFVVAGAHPAGGRYFWEAGLPDAFPRVSAEDIGRVFDAIEREFGDGSADEGRASSEKARKPGGAAASHLVDHVADWLEARGWSRGFGRKGELRVFCPWELEHTGDSGVTEAVWWRAGTGGYERGHFKCLHAHCRGRTDEEFLDAVGWHLSVLPEIEVIDESDPGLRRPSRRTGVAGCACAGDDGGDPAGDRSDLRPVPVGLDRRDVAPGGGRAPGDRVAATQEPGGGAHVPSLVGSAAVEVPSHEDAVLSWFSGTPGEGLLRDRKGLVATVRNLLRALGTEGWWRRIARDRMRDQVMWCDWRGHNAGQWQLWTDADYTRCRSQLEQDGFQPVTKDMIRDVIDAHTEDRSFDSGILWGSRLEWDGVPRVTRFLADHFQCEDNPYTRAVAECWWTAQAGRLLVPGIKMDMVITLKDAKGGTRKTSAVAAMVPSPEFACRIDLKHDDATLARLMRGKLIVEVAELRGLRGKDAEAIKDFFSATSDDIVPKWREFAKKLERRCVFVATTDQDTFLSDPVGNFRRWLPVEVGGQIDVEGIERWRDQLWAEAIVMFKAGGIRWEEAQRLAASEHEEFKIEDSWCEIVEGWLDEVADDEVGSSEGGRLVLTWGEKGVTVREMLVFGVGINAGSISRSHEMRAAEILKSLGYERKRGSRSSNERGKRVWRRPR